MTIFANLLTPEPSRYANAPRMEWPTVLLAVVIYGGWCAFTWAYASIPAWLGLPVLAILVAWHGSLQHEVLHGHPTRWRGLNDLIGIFPISLWIPYTRYKRLHLKHHNNERLTDPIDDPADARVVALRPNVARAGDDWSALAHPDVLGR